MLGTRNTEMDNTISDTIGYQVPSFLDKGIPSYKQKESTRLSDWVKNKVTI